MANQEGKKSKNQAIKKEKEEPEVVTQATSQASSKATNKQSAKQAKQTSSQPTDQVTKGSNQKSSKETPSKKQKEAVQDVQQPDQPDQSVQTEQPTVESSEEFKFHSQLASLQNEVRDLREKMLSVMSYSKKLETAYNADMKRVAKTSNKKRIRTKKTGFAKPKPVPEDLAKYIGVDPGTELSGPEVTKKVWAQLRAKNLMYEKDKRVFRTDKETSKLFNVPASVNNSVNHKDKNGFNFCTLQKYITNAFNKA